MNVRAWSLPFASWGVALSATFPCLAQEPSAPVLPPETASAAENPAAAPPASLSTVLWLSPSDPELSNRLRGQLVGTAWQLVERVADSKFHAGGRGVQLRVAFEAARHEKATAVAWVREDDTRIRVLVLDVGHSRLSVRDIPRHVADSGQQSAALETAALIVRATLASIESGSEVGDAVVEPPPAPASPADVSPERKSEEQPPPSAGSAWWARTSGQVHFNSGHFRFGPGLGLGATFEQMRIGALAHVLLPSSERTHYIDATGRHAIDLEFWQWGLALGIEYDWALSEQWTVFLGLRPGVTILHRATSSASSLQPSPDASYLLPNMGFNIGLAGLPLADVLIPEITLGARVFTRVPRMRVGPAPQSELERQPSRFEPWLGLGFRLP